MADVAYIPGERGRERRPAVGYVMVISAALLFALNGTVSKVVLQSGISPLELTQVRATGAFLGFALVLAFSRRESLRLTRRELPYLIVFGIAGVALVQWLYFVSIGRLPIGIALLIEYIAPILIAIWAWAVFKETIRKRIWAALVLALAGLSLVVEVWSGISLDGLGVAAALAAAGRLRDLRADGGARGQVARPGLAHCLRVPLRRPLLGGRAAALALPGRPPRRQCLAARQPGAILASGLAAPPLRRRRGDDGDVPARRGGAATHFGDAGRNRRHARAGGGERCRAFSGSASRSGRPSSSGARSCSQRSCWRRRLANTLFTSDPSDG